MPPRRFTLLTFIVAVSLAAIFIFSSSSRHVATTAASKVESVAIPDSLRDKLPKFEIPDYRVNWHKSTHKPPTQKNSTSGGASWYSDWTWLNPFSSSVTLDEERIVLPHLVERPPVYTYYDTTEKKDDVTKRIDQEALLTWRRAWWAKGFRPVVLTEAEAMNNPLYQNLRAKGIPAALEFEFMRWLAWLHMDGGLLSNFYCLPMGPQDDLLLAHLRRGQYELLTRFEGIGSGLFAGDKTQIKEAILEALSDARLSTYKTIVDAIFAERFKVENPSSIANYDSQVIKSKYPALAKILVEEPNKGRRTLNELINAHLHTIWQNTHSSGIVVLKPLAAHATTLVKPGEDFAHLLAECPSSLMQSSCPPNRPRCSPCVGSKMRVSSTASFRNTSTLFTVGVVPHPITTIMLQNDTQNIDVAHVRRKTERDEWVTAVTRDLLGNGRGGPSRVVSLKDIVASEYGSSRSIWFSSEHFPDPFYPPPPPPKSPSNDAHPESKKVKPFPEDWLEDLDWHFGFAIPRTSVSHGESLPPVPGPERWKGQAGVPEQKKKGSDPKPPDAKGLQVELENLQKARRSMRGTEEPDLKIRGIVEAWNLADTEIWRFVVAYRARSMMEREIFREEESKYTGTNAAAHGKNRWFG